MPLVSRTPHPFPFPSRFMGACTFAFLGVNSATLGAVGPSLVHSRALGAGTQPHYTIATSAAVRDGFSIAATFTTSTNFLTVWAWTRHHAFQNNGWDVTVGSAFVGFTLAGSDIVAAQPFVSVTLSPDARGTHRVEAPTARHPRRWRAATSPCGWTAR